MSRRAKVAVFVLGLAGFGACSATDSSSGSSSGGGQGGGGGSFIDAGSGCAYPCSGDLHSILNCEGDVVETCPADHACLEGKCVESACDAAAASNSSYGCDFWALKTDILNIGGCHAVFLANTWDTPAHFTVDYLGAKLDLDFVRVPVGKGETLAYEAYDPVAGLAPGQAALLFLSNAVADPEAIKHEAPAPDCPVTPAVSDTAVYGTGRGHGFHIAADRPVAAYQILPYGGGAAAITSATLLLPSATWDTDYIAVSAYRQSPLLNFPGPSLDILAGEDDTEVTIRPSAPIVGGPGVGGAAIGDPKVYALQRGEYVQFTQATELTGSLVHASKPVAVIGASTCMNIPVDAIACDSGQQQIPPVRAWGWEYAAVGHPVRDNLPEPSLWRAVGAVDGTELTFDPPQDGAPAQLDRGQVAEWSTDGPYVVRSQDALHPFYLAAYMKGGNGFSFQGDPEWVNVVPSAQYLESYTLFADPTYPITWLVLVRPLEEHGAKADVILDCAGAIEDWVSFASFEYAYVPLVRGNFLNVGECSSGVRTLKSIRPFGVTIWGWGSQITDPWTTWVSYAYPGGASVRSINNVEIPK